MHLLLLLSSAESHVIQTYFLASVVLKPNLHFLWGYDQIQHLPEGVFKVHLPETEDPPQVLLPLGCCCVPGLSLLTREGGGGGAGRQWRWHCRWNWRGHFPITVHSRHSLGHDQQTCWSNLANQNAVVWKWRWNIRNTLQFSGLFPPHSHYGLTKCQPDDAFGIQVRQDYVTGKDLKMAQTAEIN